ncbi:MAG: DUF4139 domain-containing protein, partial [Balneolales bacterium]
MNIKILSVVSIVLLIPAFGALAQDSNRESLDITLYNNNFSIIHDKRSLNINSGISKIGIGELPRDIRSETVFAEFNGYILQQSFKFHEAYWPEVIYKNLTDEPIRLVSESGELIEGILRSHKQGQLWLENSDGEYIYIQNAHSYRLYTEKKPDSLTESSQMNWTVQSEEDGRQDVSIYYQVRNMRWSADYNLIINEDEELMDLVANATLTNQSGMEYPDARIRLVSGDINVQTRQPMYRGNMGGAEMMSMDAADVSPQTLSEYHVFELPEKVTIGDQEQKQVTLNRAYGIDAHKHFSYQTGSLGQLRRNNNQVNVEYRLANTEEYKLGSPLPAGIVKAYQKDGELVEFIGEDHLDHTPEGQEFTISIGQAFDVVVEETQVRLAELSNRIREEEREITVINQKD